MNTAIDRKTFLKTLGCAAPCVVLGAGSSVLHAAASEPAGPSDAEKAATVHDWLTPFIQREEPNLDRATLVKLLEERGQLCCRRLEFRRKLVEESQGNVDKLVELMGKIVGPENCQREGNTVTLVYPVDKCGCGWSPKREPRPDDPYCECSKANNRTLFEIVSGKPVQAEVLDSPRRTGKPCRFVLQLS